MVPVTKTTRNEPESRVLKEKRMRQKRKISETAYEGDEEDDDYEINNAVEIDNDKELASREMVPVSKETLKDPNGPKTRSWTFHQLKITSKRKEKDISDDDGDYEVDMVDETNDNNESDDEPDILYSEFENNCEGIQLKVEETEEDRMCHFCKKVFSSVTNRNVHANKIAGQCLEKVAVGRLEEEQKDLLKELEKAGRDASISIPEVLKRYRIEIDSNGQIMNPNVLF